MHQCCYEKKNLEYEFVFSSLVYLWKMSCDPAICFAACSVLNICHASPS